MTLDQLMAAAAAHRAEVGGDVEARILVTHPVTGENMLFDIEGVDRWEGPAGPAVTVQNFPAEKEPHLKLVTP